MLKALMKLMPLGNMQCKAVVNQGTVIIESQIDFDFEITLLTVRAKKSKTGE